MLRPDQWTEIHRLHQQEKRSIKSIVRITGFSRNTVRRALLSTEPPRYRRTKKRAVLTDPVDPRIRQLLATSPGITATAIAQELQWSHSMSTLRQRVRQLRAEQMVEDSVLN